MGKGGECMSLEAIKQVTEAEQANKQRKAEAQAVPSAPWRRPSGLARPGWRKPGLRPRPRPVSLCGRPDAEGLRRPAGQGGGPSGRRR